jgi:hypothetical protein
MVGTAIRFVVGRMGRADRPGHGVVDIAPVYRPVTAGPATGQIAPPDELGILGRGSIPRIRRRGVGGHRHRRQRGRRRQSRTEAAGSTPNPGRYPGLSPDPSTVACSAST